MKKPLEIVEYPYTGKIWRVILGQGRAKDTEELLYEGEMDEHMTTPEQGSTLQTAAYIISIPLTQDEYGEWIVPRKGDKILLSRYGEEIELVVDNAEPSQLGGVSIYSTRQNW